jgi:endonuclease/exonuclease/phosphatase (EEP) superfamily protein YafD
MFKQINLSVLSETALFLLKVLIAGLSLVGCFLAYGAELGSTKWWIFNLAANLRMQLAIGLTCLCIAALLVRCKKSVVICVVALLPAVFPIAYYWQYGLTATTNDTIRVLQINVYRGNADYDKVVEYIRRESPDLLLIEELSPAWDSELRRRLTEYPYRFTIPIDTPQGIGEFSRVPLRNPQPLKLAGRQCPAIAFEIQQGSSILHVIHTHLSGPTSRGGFKLQSRQLLELSEIAASKPRPLLIAGDFNATPWTREFQAMLQSAGVQTTCTTKGYHTTWPSAIPSKTVFGKKLRLPAGLVSVAWRIPIDQFLISNRIVLSKLKVGTYVGSDHYPVTADLVIR